MLEILLNLFENYKETCSITKVRNKCVTFARNSSYLKYLSGVQKDIWVIVPWKMVTPSSSLKGIKYYPIRDSEYWFTMIHNYINKNKTQQPAFIGKNCKLDETVILGVQGLKIANSPNGSKLQFKHTGGIVIEDDVEIGPYSVVHRGTMNDTIIKRGCKFGAYTNIGHNCEIGENTIMAASVILNGGVKVGKNCWFASGSLIKHHIDICDNVVIGLGAVVVKDITEPGIYIGNPAKYLKPITKGWNF